MYTTSIVSTLATLATIAAALPSSGSLSLSARQDACFPWYLNTQIDGSCQAQNTPQFASGPAPGRQTQCESLQGQWGAMSLSLDGNDQNGCGENYTITLYTTPDCSEIDPFRTTTSGCFTASNNGKWIAFSAEQAEFHTES